MSPLPKISIRVDGSMTPAECVELAIAADDAGFAGVWFAENAFARGILPAAAACAGATKRLRINSGVFNPFSRHPTMMAMEIGALDELAGGRATLSIGSGIMSAAAKMGLNAEKPVPALRDAVTIVRALLRGEEANHTGAFFSATKVKLDYPARRDIPIYLAGRGHLTAKLAGEMTDGIIVSNMCSVEYAGKIAQAMQASRERIGRPGHGEAIQYMPCSVHRDRAVALDAAKVTVGEMAPRFWALGQKLGSAKQALLAGTQIGEAEFASAAAQLREGTPATQALDERYATAFSLFGTPQDCLSLARRYKSAGISELALTFSGPAAVGEIAMLGEAIRGA